MTKLKILPTIALALALLLVLWFLVALFGAKLGAIDKLTAFGTMTAQIGSMAAMAVALVAAIALIVSIVVRPRGGWGKALIALAIPLVVLAGFAQLRAVAGSVPFIYDVTTDTADAPQFSPAMVAARTRSGANPLMDFARPLQEYEKWADNREVGERTSAQLIAEGYPDLAPLLTPRSAADALDAVEAAMRDSGIENIAVDAAAGTVEGTAVVFWYGFEDDVVARVRPASSGTGATGTIVDLRSTSRLGTSDLGVNAARIAALKAAISARLNPAGE